MVVINLGDVVDFRVPGGRGQHVVAELIHVGREPVHVSDADDLGDVLIVERHLCDIVIAVGHGKRVEDLRRQQLPIEISGIQPVLMHVYLHISIQSIDF